MRSKNVEDLLQGDRVTLWASLWGEQVATVEGIDINRQAGQVLITTEEIEWAKLIVSIGEDIPLEG
jgi:hypothetical protein